MNQMQYHCTEDIAVAETSIQTVESLPILYSSSRPTFAGIIPTRENFTAAVNRVALVPSGAGVSQGRLRTTDAESEERGRRSVDVSRDRGRAKNWPQGVRLVAGGTMSPEGPLGRRSPAGNDRPEYRGHF